MALTIFDLDETLIAADSDHEWGQFVVDRGLVHAQEHKKKNDDFYEQYKAGQLDIDEYQVAFNHFGVFLQEPCASVGADCA